MGKLSATAVKAATRPGRVGDGGGLFLLVQPGGNEKLGLPHAEEWKPSRLRAGQCFEKIAGSDAGTCMINPDMDGDKL